ncbi:MAG TPA: Imm1 family immunity protein [Pseudonocardiaceae bacterium]
MTLTAYGPTYRDGVEGGFTRTVNSPADVRELVALLGDESVFTAAVESEHAVLDVHVRNGFGYLLYNGPEMVGAYSIGDPASPAVTASETGFPAGSGVALDLFTTALIEFLQTGTLPAGIRWGQADAS